MITVKQAKDKGVVFVEGDVINGITINRVQAHGISSTKLPNPNHCLVSSFTLRCHTTHKMPCDGDLPVIANMIFGGHFKGTAKRLNWNVIRAWKPDLEALEERSIKKEEKQYTYDKVTNLTPSQVICEVLNGDDSYFAKVGENYVHLNKSSSLEDFVNIHHRKDIEQLKANKNLFNAAPDMYKALELMIRYSEMLEEQLLSRRVSVTDLFLDHKNEQPPEDVAECALAKARGEL